MIKKISFLILSIPVLYSVHAQNSSAFLKGGVNLANISYNENGNIDDANMLVSFHAGIQGDFPIASFLSLQPGFFLTGKVSKKQAGNTSESNYFNANKKSILIAMQLSHFFKKTLLAIHFKSFLTASNFYLSHLCTK